MRLRVALFTGLLAALPAAAQAAPDYAAMLTAATDGPIVAGYRDYQAKAEALDQQVKAMCAAAPSAPSVDAARAAFHAAMDSWQQVQWVSFGPVEGFHRGQRVQFWPDKKNAGDRQMLALLKDRKAESLEGNRIVFASVAVQGLPALEMLMFDANQAPKLLEDTDDRTLRCRMAQGISANLAVLGGELVQEWTKEGGFADTFKAAGNGVNPYADARQAASQMFNALHAELAAIAEVKLIYPMGTTAAEARPSRAESWRSKRSARNISANLDSLRQAYTVAFAPGVAAVGKAAASDRFLAALTDAQGALKKQPLVLEDALTDAEGWKSLNVAKTKIKAAAQILETDIANALDLQVGFNGLDGD